MMKWAGTRRRNGKELLPSKILPHTALVIMLAFRHRDRRMSFPLSLNKSNEKINEGVVF